MDTKALTVKALMARSEGYRNDPDSAADTAAWFDGLSDDEARTDMVELASRMGSPSYGVLNRLIEIAVDAPNALEAVVRVIEADSASAGEWTAGYWFPINRDWLHSSR